MVFTPCGRRLVSLFWIATAVDETKNRAVGAGVEKLAGLDVFDPANRRRIIAKQPGKIAVRLKGSS